MENQHDKSSAKSNKDTGKKSGSENSGNFKNDPERAAEAVKKAGKAAIAEEKK